LARPSVHKIIFEPALPFEAIEQAIANAGPNAVDPPVAIFFKI